MSDLSTIIAKLEHLEGLDARVPALMDEFCDDITEDNRVGVLKGTDKDDVPMKEPAYRTGKGKAGTKARTGNKYGVLTLGHYLGPELKLGNVLVAKGADANGNLTTKEYKQLTGPPLAPRGARSRSIANLIARRVYREGATWVAAMGWANVVSKKGKPFLIAHFEGKNGLPVRDLRGVRKWGRARAKTLVNEFVKQELEGLI